MSSVFMESASSIRSAQTSSVRSTHGKPAIRASKVWSEGQPSTHNSRSAARLSHSAESHVNSIDLASNSRRNRKVSVPLVVIDGEGRGIAARCSSMFKTLCSIRIITAAMSLLLIAATAAILLSVTFVFSLSAAEDIATDYAILIAKKAKGDVEAYLSEPLNNLEAWQYSLSQQEVVTLPSDTATYPEDGWVAGWRERAVGPMAASNFTFHSTNFGFADGNAIICVTFYANEEFRCQVYEWGFRNKSDPSQVTNLTDYDYFRSNYSISNISTSPEPYDPRTRTWYKQGVTAPGVVTWSNAFLGAVPTVPCISASAGIYNATGGFLGVSSVFLNLNRVATFLGELLAVDHAVSFLIDNQDMLLASTYPLPVSTTTPIPSGYVTPTPLASNCLMSDTANGATLSLINCRERVQDYNYPPLHELTLSDPAYIANGEIGVSRLLKLSGKMYFVAIVPIETPGAQNMGWRFAVFLPEEQLTSGIIRGRNIAIYICIGVVAIAAVTCLVVIAALLRPLNAVAERMYRVAMMEDVNEKDSAAAISRLLEIATIQAAFNTMTAELAKIKSFLPQSVLEQLYGGTTDEGDEGEMDSLTLSLKSGLSNSKVSGYDAKNKETSGFEKSTITPTHTTSSDGHCVQTLNTSVKISSRKVTILSLNVLGFHPRALEKNHDQLVRQHDSLVKAIQEACAEYRGVMDGFQGDRFIISFNAVTSVANHSVLSAHCAIAAQDLVWARTSQQLTSGQATGLALVGNLGSATTKRFTVLSSVVTTAVLLERLCKKYCAQDPMTLTAGAGSLLEDMESIFELLTLDTVLLPAAKGKPKASRVCGVMNVKEACGDEWMYEMEEGAKNAKFSDVNAAFDLFMRGMVTDAEASVMQQLANMNGQSTSTVVDRVMVRSVLERLCSLIRQAKGTESAAAFATGYSNTLSDFFLRCSLSMDPTTVQPPKRV